MKIASYTAITIIISWSILTVLQLWGVGVSGSLYIKISITMAIIGGAIILASLISREYLRNKRIQEKFKKTEHSDF
jgi:predicted membrane channel-forming protein YqfA (hemolysin III family)